MLKKENVLILITIILLVVWKLLNSAIGFNNFNFEIKILIFIILPIIILFSVYRSEHVRKKSKYYKFVLFIGYTLSIISLLIAALITINSKFPKYSGMLEQPFSLFLDVLFFLLGIICLIAVIVKVRDDSTK